MALMTSCTVRPTLGFVGWVVSRSTWKLLPSVKVICRSGADVPLVRTPAFAFSLLTGVSSHTMPRGVKLIPTVRSAVTSGSRLTMPLTLALESQPLLRSICNGCDSRLEKV